LEPRQLFAELACLQVGAISCRRFYFSRMSLFRGFLQSIAAIDYEYVGEILLGHTDDPQLEPRKRAALDQAKEAGRELCA